jgi:hypothetical protein
MKILGANDIEQRGILIEMDAGYISPSDERNLAIIKESKNLLDYSKPFEFYAVLQKYGVPNRNGRIYPENILKRESENYIKLIKQGKAMSELNHPESSLIDLDRVSHLITDMWWDAHILMGKLKLLTSPGFHERGIVSTKADIAANLLRHGATLGISSRGVGSLAKKGEQNEVQSDFELICFDLVSSPSTPGAYLFSDINDKNKFDENIEEERKLRQPNVSDKKENKSLDLMKRLSDYLGK